MKSLWIYITLITCIPHWQFYAQHLKDFDTLHPKGKMKYLLEKALDQSDYKKALIIADNIELYSIEHGDSLYMAHSYDIKSSIFMFKKDLINSKINLKKGSQIFARHKYYSNVVELNSGLANILRGEGKLDSCFYILNTTHQRYVSDTLTKKSLRYFYNAKEVSHFVAGRIDSSLYYIFKRVALIEKKNHYQLGTAYLVLSKNFYKVRDLQKALNYINESIENYNNESHNTGISTSYAYILKGNILLELKQYQEAEFCANYALSLIKNKDSKEYATQIKILLSKLYWKTGQLEKLPNLSYHDLENQNITNGTLFDLYLTKLEQELSNKNWEEAEQLIYKLNSTIDQVSGMKLKQSYYQLSATYWAHIKSFKKSYVAQKKYFEIQEKINTKQQTYTAYDLDQKYQSVKKNEEIVQQEFKIKEQENRLLKKEKHQTYLTLSIVSAILAFISLLFIYRQRQKLKNKEIVTLQKQQEIIGLEALIKGEEKERNRLGQDLHDGINGDLSVIKYKITSIEFSKLSEKEKKIHNEVVAMIDNTVEQVRLISHNLAPSSLQNFDLIEAIQQLCDKVSTSNSVNISFQYYGNQLIIKKEKEISIYRIIQELINNIVKHASGTEALVQINKHKNRLHITVEDNGKGFDLNIKSNGIGLQNIKSRVSFLRADLDIISNQKGTSFSIDIDLNKVNEI